MAFRSQTPNRARTARVQTSDRGRPRTGPRTRSALGLAGALIALSLVAAWLIHFAADSDTTHGHAALSGLSSSGHAAESDTAHSAELLGPDLGPGFGAAGRAGLPQEPLAPVPWTTADSAASRPGQFSFELVAVGSAAPIAGAELLLRGAGGERARAESDASGRAVIDAPFAIADLQVTSATHVDLARPGVRAEGVVSLALIPSGSLLGRVDAPGRAQLVRAEVRLFSEVAQRAGRASSVSPLAADGTFRFADIEPGVITVVVACPDFPLVVEPNLVIEAGVEHRVTLRAPRAERIQGRVLDASGVPALGIRVYARPELAGVSESTERTGRPETESGADGTFALEPVALGRHVVVAESAAGPRVEREVLVRETQGATLELRLPASATVTGRVVDESGRALAGVAVGIVASDRARRVDWTGLETLAREPGGARNGGGLLGRTLTDVAGRFRFESLPASAALIVLAQEDPRLGAAELQTPRDGSTPVDVVVRMRPAPRVRGLVLGLGGAPVAGAQVAADLRPPLDAAAGASGGRRGLPIVGVSGGTTTDAGGAFELTCLEGGNLRLRVRADGLRSAWAEFEVLPGMTQLPEPIRLEADVTLAGTVCDERGDAVPGASVRLWLEGDGRRRRGTRADRYGRFLVSGLRDGIWSLEVRASGYQTLLMDGKEAPRLVLPAVEPLALVLEAVPPRPRGAVTGEFIARGSGDPVEGARLDGLGDAAALFDGARFRVLGLAAGKTDLTVSAPGFETTRLASFELLADRTTDLGALELRPATRLTIRVVDADGKPVRGAKVTLERLPEERAGRGGLARRLDVPAARGGREHRLNETPRARWRVVATHPEQGRYRAEHDVSGARTDLTVKLARP